MTKTQRKRLGSLFSSSAAANTFLFSKVSWIGNYCFRLLKTIAKFFGTFPSWTPVAFNKQAWLHFQILKLNLKYFGCTLPRKARIKASKGKIRYWRLQKIFNSLLCSCSLLEEVKQSQSQVGVLVLCPSLEAFCSEKPRKEPTHWGAQAALGPCQEMCWGFYFLVPPALWGVWHLPVLGSPA